MTVSDEFVFFGVTGAPILHSRSPRLFAAACEAVGIRGACVRLAAESSGEALSVSRRAGLRGLSVTSPFKEAMAKAVDALDETASRIGAVNAVTFADGRTVGHNTDAEGAAAALQRGGLRLEGSHVLVLGTGGAARAVVAGLAMHGAQVTLAGRDLDKASAIARGLGHGWVSLDSRELVRASEACDALVGCLATAERVVPAGALRPSLTVLDAYYSEESALAMDARERGCRVVDGLDWLAFQAGLSFRLFTGLEAPCHVLLSAVRTGGDRAPRNIALIGFMGSGKDAAAEALSRTLGWPAIYADREIERKAGMRVSEIFRTLGEGAFRDMEEEVLQSVLRASGHVVSCGGGAVLRESSRKALAASALVVWLWAGPEVIMNRLAADATRPLLETPDREGRVLELLSERSPVYAASADLLVSTEGRTPEGVGERIADEIRRSFGRIG